MPPLHAPASRFSSPVDLLTTDVTHRDGWTVLTPRGQLDVATAPAFRQQLVEAQFSEDHRVLVDLDGVEFIDSMGIGVLVGGLKRARSHAGSFRVRCTRERILHLFALTGLDEVFEVVAELDDATSTHR